MKRFHAISLTIVGALIVVVLSFATSAYALPELLGQAAGEEYRGKNTQRIQKLETIAGEKIECTAATLAGKQSSDTTATFSITFSGCKAVTALGIFACNTSGDAKEVILSTGATDYVGITAKGSGSAAILFLPSEITIECTALVKLKVRGHLICEIAFPLMSSTSKEAFCTQGFGHQTDKLFFNDEESIVSGQHLEVSKNGGAFEEAGEEAFFLITFVKSVAFMNE